MSWCFTIFKLSSFRVVPYSSFLTFSFFLTILCGFSIFFVVFFQKILTDTLTCIDRATKWSRSVWRNDSKKLDWRISRFFLTDYSNCWTYGYILIQEQNCKKSRIPNEKSNWQFLSHATELFSEKALFGRELHGESSKHDILGAQTTSAETGSAREESASFLN